MKRPNPTPRVAVSQGRGMGHVPPLDGRPISPRNLDRPLNIPSSIYASRRVTKCSTVPAANLRTADGPAAFRMPAGVQKPCIAPRCHDCHFIAQVGRLPPSSIIMPSMRSLLFGICATPCVVQAHMQMLSPLPLNSPLDPVNTNPDYDYKSPLHADGSDFPCKNYQDPTHYPSTYTSKATWIAGETYNMTISADGANHDGGSCQLSLSYDNGQTFKVIKSMIGGCPVTLSYSFNIPSYAPASDSVLFAWSWFNLVGNREMYMDCARVEIQRPSAGRHRRAHIARRATNSSSMQDLPDLFTCNINNGCTSIENEDVHFPNPGADVVYGQDLAQTTPGSGRSRR